MNSNGVVSQPANTPPITSFLATPTQVGSRLKFIEIGSIKGSMTWKCIGTVTQIQKICRSFQALGDKPFAYSYSLKLRAGAFLALGYEYHYYNIAITFVQLHTMFVQLHTVYAIFDPLYAITDNVYVQSNF
ncbi:amino acid permease 2 [Prunus dulcis]|uniref:Amino acid permease 2 n=1 Tax=Prunus dulcis TaxID=3755 RepID=A0A4Y1RBP8_PRUDU|nr:amino acid permease 2 [Prunus dulcis]